MGLQVSVRQGMAVHVLQAFTHLPSDTGGTASGEA